MSGTVEEVLALADVGKFLDRVGSNSTTNLCHNACVWLMARIKRHQISEYNIAWCIGTFWGEDHSWLIVQDPETGDETIIDMTVNQFVDRPVPWTGVMNDQYKVFDSVLLCDTDKLHELVDRIGS